MPHYWLGIIFDGESHVDPEGIEFSDLASAHRAAVEIATERLKGNAEEFLRQNLLQVTVSDQAGTILAAVTVTAHGGAPAPTQRVNKETSSCRER